jgi:hypothetical protein
VPGSCAADEPFHEHRDALLEMARHWDELADRLQRQIGKRHVEPGSSAEDDASE